MRACSSTSSRHAAEIERRLTAGDDINLGDKQGFTPLHRAAQRGAAAAAKLLIDRGAKVDSVDAFGNTPLFLGVFNSKGRGELLALLANRGPIRRERITQGRRQLG